MPDSVALTALVVSLVALFTTIGQLLQQYFATADGFRRCQPSVIGLWAKKTKLRWRWAEFRFETTFMVPRIKYGPLHNGVGKNFEVSQGFCSMVNSKESLEGSMTYPGWESLAARRYYDSDQLACWISLLAQLHMQGGDAMKFFPQKPGSVENDTMVPLVQFIVKSWDFMPTDIVRPMASSTVSDIAVMARRLGMVWKSFDPGSGSMRAEGNGHVFTSTMVRSLGTVIQYTYTSRKNDGNCAYIPLKEADKLGFGLVEVDHRLFGPEFGFDLDVGSYDGVLHTLPRFMSKSNQHRSSKRPNREVKRILEAIHSNRDFVPALNDLVSICSAMLSVANTPSGVPWQIQIPAPNIFLRGVTSSREGFRVFKNRLKSLIASKKDPTAQSKLILQCLETLENEAEHRWEWEEEWEVWSDDPSPSVRACARTAKDLVRKYHSEVTNYLRKSKVDFHDLVIAHMRLALTKPLKPLNIPKDTENVDFDMSYGLQHPDVEILEAVHSYFDGLSHLVENVLLAAVPVSRGNGRPCPSRDDVEDAWLSMVFRAFCWQRSHIMLTGVPPLPSEHWNSKMPVYIG